MDFTHRAGFDNRPAGHRGHAVIHLLLALCIAAAVGLAIATAVTPARAAGHGAFAATGPGPSGYAPGTIVVSQGQRRLFLIGEDGGAISYPVAVGKFGKQWSGSAIVDGKYRNPAWAPPAEVKRAEPWLPDYIPGGSSRNPMGMRALTLSGGEYAIHGTNRPDSIGTAASFGCIRMLNRDIVDLYDRVDVGTPVVVGP